MLKRKVSKSKSKFSLKQLLSEGRKALVCKECDTYIVEVAFDIAAVTCAYCVQRQVPAPESIKPKPEGEKFPRGWALKSRYVHVDGRVFEKGKETSEKVESVTSKPNKKVTKKKTPKRRR
jgi:hypothetical protein